MNITRPTASAEIRILGLDDSVSKEEVRYTIADIGGCHIESIKVGEIKWMTNGLGLIWARCPIQAANRMVAKERIRMGWTTLRAEMLEKRPIQCYRCWEYGHVRFSCKSDIDRKKCCYNCGETGHTARVCGSKDSTCVLCREKGYMSNHRLGSKWCKANKAMGKARQLPRRKEEGKPNSERKNEESPDTGREAQRVRDEGCMDYELQGSSIKYEPLLGSPLPAPAVHG